MREVRSIVPDEDLQPDNLTVTLKDPSQPVAQRRTDDLFISASPRSIGWHHDGGYARVAVTVYGSGTAVTVRSAASARAAARVGCTTSPTTW